jgi:hypothetical protein
MYRIDVPFSDGEITFVERKYRAEARISEYYAAPRLYVSVQDETVLENLMNRRVRPYNAYKTLIHGSDLDQILDLSKLSWSQKAGCSCPCSPGFILNKQLIQLSDTAKWMYWDAWVTFTSVGADKALVTL